METLKQKLRTLLVEYSAEEVHRTLEDIFQEDYAFLQKHFTAQVKAQAQVKPQPQPKQEQTQTQTQTQPKNDSVPSAPLAKKPVKITPNTRIQVNKEPIIRTEPDVVVTEKTHQQEVLEDQEKKEKERFAELVKQGVNPESLLTKENLTEWLQSKEYSFAYIARELVGLTQAQVRYAAKLYNIESPVSLRRKGLVASKMKGKN